LTLIDETAPVEVAAYRMQVMLSPSPVSVLLPTVVVPNVEVAALAMPAVLAKLTELTTTADKPTNKAPLRQPELGLGSARILDRGWKMRVIGLASIR